jgi:hypothetical protein
LNWRGKRLLTRASYSTLDAALCGIKANSRDSQLPIEFEESCWFRIPAQTADRGKLPHWMPGSPLLRTETAPIQRALHNANEAANG